MHILYVQQLFALPGSPGTQRSWEMAQYWKEAGHTVSILCSSANFDSAFLSKHLNNGVASIHYEGIQLHVLDVAYSHFMSFPRRIWSFLSFYTKALSYGKQIQGVDVLLAYSAPLSVGFLGRKLAKKLNCPFVFEAADVWPDVPIGMGIIRNLWLIRFLQNQTSKIYRDAEVICTFTEDMKEQICSHGVPENKVEVIHNGVDLGAFPISEKPASSQKEPIKVIYTGSLGMANQVSQLVYAWQKIEQKWGTVVQCEIVGEGTEKDKMESLIQELGLQTLTISEPVAFQEIPALLETAEIGLVCVAPFAVLEANGATKAFEYMAAGLAIVLNYEGWLADYLKRYDCGLSAPLGNIDAWAKQIDRLIQDLELRKRQGLNGRQLVELQFDRPTLARRMLQLFERLKEFA